MRTKGSSSDLEVGLDRDKAILGVSPVFRQGPSSKVMADSLTKNLTKFTKKKKKYFTQVWTELRENDKG